MTTAASLYGRALAIDPANPGILILATDDGIYKSTDGGGSWTLKSSTPAYEPVFDPNHQGSIYAAGQRLLLRSADDGETWTRVNLGRTDLDGPFSVTVDPELPDNIFLAPFYGATIGCSSDGGATWTWLTAGLGSNLLGNYARGSVIAQTNPEVLYVVSPTAGLIALTLPH